MSAAVKEAAVNEALELSYLFRQNAALRHGVPKCSGPQRVGGLKDDEPKTPVVNITNKIPAASAANESSSPGGGAADTVKRSLLRTAAPFLLSAVVGSGVGPAAWWLLKKDEPPPVVQPAEPDSGSLLQYLQDQMLHVPEGEQWQTNQ
jgi:hypothetical protein